MKQSSLLVVLLIIVSGSFAQAFFDGPLSGRRYSGFGTSPFFIKMDSVSVAKKKFNLQTYSSLSVGMMMWKGGSASYLSAPVGLVLSRPLSNNTFAFAAVSAAPSVISFRQSFANSNFKNTGLQGMNQQYQLGGYARAELGLGYTNDARTFQITGSIGIERNTYPYGMPGMIAPVGATVPGQMMYNR